MNKILINNNPFQDIFNVISKIINRVAVTLTVVLHLSVKAYSKYLDRKQQKAELISGFYAIETSSEKHSVSIGSGLVSFFW